MIDNKHPLDSPYPSQILEMIRDHIHKKITRKIIAFDRSDYIIVWDEATPNDIMYSAGRCVQICLGCSPFDGNRTEQLTRRALSASFINELRRYNAIVRQKDAVAYYGIEIEGDCVYPAGGFGKELTRYETLVENFVKVTVRATDGSKKRVTVMIRNGNGFDGLREGIKILEGRS